MVIVATFAFSVTVIVAALAAPDSCANTTGDALLIPVIVALGLPGVASFVAAPAVQVAPRNTI